MFGEKCVQMVPPLVFENFDGYQVKHEHEFVKHEHELVKHEFVKHEYEFVKHEFVKHEHKFMKHEYEYELKDLRPKESIAFIIPGASRAPKPLFL